MLTPEQLTTITEQYAYATVAREGYDSSELLKDMHAVLDEVERLQAALIAKDAVLAQFSDDMNWYRVGGETIDGEYLPLVFMWDEDNNPIDLAEQAMLQGHD